MDLFRYDDSVHKLQIPADFFRARNRVTNQTSLLRGLTLAGALAVVVGTMIGTGVF